MNLSRRWQPLPDYWYCADQACVGSPDPNGGAGPSSEADARAHTEATGHETRCSRSQKIIWTRPQTAGAR